MSTSIHLDRHGLTNKRLLRVRRLKRLTLPILGALVMAGVGEAFGIDTLAIAKGIWGWLAALFAELGVDAGNSLGRRILVNLVVGGFFGLLFTSFLNRLGLIDRFFPDPPAFVFCDLETERRITLLGSEAEAPLPLIGRDAELDVLARLLVRDGPNRFTWQALTGPTGVGKTRLAVEWLAKAEAEKWDIGVIDQRQLGLLRDWKARRPTALVLDEARSTLLRQDTGTASQLETALIDLLHASCKKNPVRVLLLGQSTIWSAGQAAQNLRPYEAKQHLVLEPLSDEAMAPLAEHLAQLHGGDPQTIIRESAGRPRHAIIIAKAPAGTATYEDALNAWANLLVPELANDEDQIPAGLGVGLIASALVGPILTSQLPEYDVGPLLRFFPAARRRDLRDTLPQLRPDDLAQLLALRLLDRIPSRMRDDRVVPLLLEHPEALERSLGEIWRDHPPWVEGHRDHPAENSWKSDAASQLRDLQAAFDARWPERVAAMHRRIESAVESIAGDADLATAHRAAGMVAAIADYRPFDLVVRLAEGDAALVAINLYGKSGTAGQPGAFSALEQWNARLVAMVAVRLFAANPTIRLREAQAAVNAISHYGKFAGIAKDATERAACFIALEEWGKRFDAIYRDQPTLTADPAIRLQEAMASVNAINRYGQAAAAAKNAAERAARLTALEEWGKRFPAIYRDQPILAVDPAIRLAEARSAVNAISGYGDIARKAKDAGERAAWFVAMEEWGTRLDVILVNPVLADYPVTRLLGASAAFNAINSYGNAAGKAKDEGEQAACFAAMEEWATRLDVTLVNPELTDDPVIRLLEANAAFSAITSYSEAAKATKDVAKRVAWFAPLEGWGKRFDMIYRDQPALASDIAIRLKEAKTTINAMFFYGLAARETKDLFQRAACFAALEEWGKRFDTMYRNRATIAADPAIRLHEAIAAANAMEHYRMAAVAAEDVGERADCLAALEEWGWRFDTIYHDQPELAADPAIRLQEAKAAFIAVNHYGQAAAAAEADVERAASFATLEEWGNRFATIYRDQPTLAADPAIRLEESKVASKAIIHYGTAGAAPDWQRWRGRFARIIQRFPYRAEFSELAHKQNLSLADQESRGWPYGRYQWDDEGREHMLQPPHADYAEAPPVTPQPAPPPDAAPAPKPSASTAENTISIPTKLPKPPKITPPASRNDPCPCGSGKRYKHCHGVQGEAKADTDGAI